MSKLNREEKEILDAFDAGKLRRAKDAKTQIRQHQKYAEATLRKDASILHKYVEGRLKEDG